MNTRIIYYGDNLDILRKHIATESVDLVYLDPPFKSQQQYDFFPMGVSSWDIPGISYK